MTYTRDVVEHLLPAVWDKHCMLGMTNPTAPDPDMPRGTQVKKTVDGLWAHIADIKAAWEKSPLTFKQRQALLLRYGLDMTEASAGAVVGISREAMKARVVVGVGHMTAWLNGTASNLDDEDVMV